MPAIAFKQPYITSEPLPAIPRRGFRIESVDVLRGIAMILMALDHTRDFLGVPGVSPTDLAHTTIPLFFTRWITHFCAPVFFLLTGTGAFLSLTAKSRRQVSKFLFTRGLWLIFLELTLFRCLGLQFNFDYQTTLLNVLWALGWAMLVLSVFVYAPLWVSATFGLFIIAGHNALDAITWQNPVWSILHRCALVVKSPQYSVFVAYPLIPWIGVTLAGFSIGRIYEWTRERRRAFLLRASCVAVSLFLILRGVNIYGDPIRWSAQKSTAFTVLCFLNTNKYPPSLLFLLMTLGPALLFLCWIDGRKPWFFRPVLVFGRVPFFFFLLHIPLIHLIALTACYVRYQHVHWMFESPSIAQFPFTAPPGWGLPLTGVYLLWGCVLIALYPLSDWFARLKQRRTDVWLRYV